MEQHSVSLVRRHWVGGEKAVDMRNKKRKKLILLTRASLVSKNMFMPRV